MMDKARAGRVLRAVVVASTIPGVAFAQKSGPPETPNYSKATEVTLNGTVQRIVKHNHSGCWIGVLLTLKTDDGVVDVHLGPVLFLAMHQAKFARGEMVAVTGSRIAYGHTRALLAREIEAGGRRLFLRNTDGVAQWTRP